MADDLVEEVDIGDLPEAHGPAGPASAESLETGPRRHPGVGRSRSQRDADVGDEVVGGSRDGGDEVAFVVAGDEGHIGVIQRHVVVQADGNDRDHRDDHGQDGQQLSHGGTSMKV